MSRKPTDALDSYEGIPLNSPERRMIQNRNAQRVYRGGMIWPSCSIHAATDIAAQRRKSRTLVSGLRGSTKLPPSLLNLKASAAPRFLSLQHRRRPLLCLNPKMSTTMEQQQLTPFLLRSNSIWGMTTLSAACWPMTRVASLWMLHLQTCLMV